MHLLFRNTNNKDSKCNWVMDSLYKGWPNTETADRSLVEPLAGHFWGFIAIFGPKMIMMVMGFLD